MRVKCNNPIKGCYWEWNYKGKKPEYAYITCPTCHKVTQLKKLIEQYKENNIPK
jgi:hypothetical protein